MNGSAEVGRREAIKRIGALMGGALSAPTLAGLLAGCEVPVSSDFRPRTLEPAQLRHVGEIAEMIIPETDTPGAAAARVHHYIDLILTDFHSAEEVSGFVAALDGVDDRARAMVGHSWQEASAAEKGRVLEALDAEAFPDPVTEPTAYAAVEARIAAGDVPFMRTMKELTVAGYYTSRVGQTVELRLVPFGTFDADLSLDEVGRAWA
ncbi:MAG: gluconate 2-dehydrogenase subunit 3 family protein [Longimicrobiales bacterium]